MVTCNWWDETYLNEGFARYYGFLAGAALFEEWNNWDFFVTDRLVPVMKVDANGLQNAVIKPVSIGTGTSLGFAVNEAFGTITYNKGGAINRMMANYLGANWTEAMRYHLQKYQFTNPTVADLIDSLETVR